MVIKVISLWQPWAWAMWNCLKEYETRSAHATVVAQLRKYEGWIGIHAAQMPMHRAIELTFDGDKERCKEWFERFLDYANDCPIGKEHHGVLGGLCRRGQICQTQQVAESLPEREIFFGNYAEGRRAIHCPEMLKLAKPVPMRGYQSAWDWEVPREIEEMLTAVSA